MTNLDTAQRHAELSDLTRALRSPQPPSQRAETLGNLRRLLPTLETASIPTQPIADAVSHVLRAHPSDLVLAHRAVAILAHPFLSGGAGVDRAIVTAMERLAMSAAFQHTAMAALQNAAAAASSASSMTTSSSGAPPAGNSNSGYHQYHIDRDAIILAVVSAMRTHHGQNGVLLRGVDLIAFHLNQPTKPANTATYRVATRAVIDSVDKLCCTPQGASTALLALVATARHISSLAAFGAAGSGGCGNDMHSQPSHNQSNNNPSSSNNNNNNNNASTPTHRNSTTSRLSRGASSSCIVDHDFAYAVVLAMTRHRTTAQVQKLGCQLIRTVAAGSTSLARASSKELYAAGATATLVDALRTHASDVHVVDNGVMALRSLLLGGGFHGRSVKPGLHVEAEFALHVAQVVEHVADAVAVKDRDLGSAAAVLAMDLRAALVTANEGGRILSGFGKKILRRLRFGSDASALGAVGGGGKLGDESTAEASASGASGNSGIEMMTQNSSTSGGGGHGAATSRSGGSGGNHSSNNSNNAKHAFYEGDEAAARHAAAHHQPNGHGAHTNATTSMSDYEEDDDDDDDLGFGPHPTNKPPLHHHNHTHSPSHHHSHHHGHQQQQHFRKHVPGHGRMSADNATTATAMMTRPVVRALSRDGRGGKYPHHHHRHHEQAFRKHQHSGSSSKKSSSNGSKPRAKDEEEDEDDDDDVQQQRRASSSSASPRHPVSSKSNNNTNGNLMSTSTPTTSSTTRHSSSSSSPRQEKITSSISSTSGGGGGGKDKNSNSSGRDKDRGERDRDRVAAKLTRCNSSTPKMFSSISSHAQHNNISSSGNKSSTGAKKHHRENQHHHRNSHHYRSDQQQGNQQQEEQNRLFKQASHHRSSNHSSQHHHNHGGFNSNDTQVSLNRRWRSVSGRWARGGGRDGGRDGGTGKRWSTGARQQYASDAAPQYPPQSTGGGDDKLNFVDHREGHRDGQHRKGPLALASTLSRQPSAAAAAMGRAQVFGGGPDGQVIARKQLERERERERELERGRNNRGKDVDMGMGMDMGGGFGMGMGMGMDLDVVDMELDVKMDVGGPRPAPVAMPVVVPVAGSGGGMGHGPGGLRI